MANSRAEPIGLEQGWSEIEKAINSLIAALESDMSDTRAPFTSTEYSRIYTICYDMCVQRAPNNWSNDLYQRHSSTIRTYLTDRVLPVLKEKHGDSLALEIVKRWKHHEVMDKWMRKFFMYLDRYHVKQQSLPLLHEAALLAFRVVVFNAVQGPFVEAVLDLVHRVREGQSIDDDLLRCSVVVFCKMGSHLEYYKDFLETPFLAASKEYYLKKSQEWIVTDSTPSYLLKAEAALKDEENRILKYFERLTLSKLLSVCQTEMLQNHEKTLLHKEGSGCRAMLEAEKKEDLNRLFTLYEPIEQGLEPISAILKEHVTKMGHEIIERRQAEMKQEKERKGKSKGRPMDSDKFVQSLLDLHDKYKELVLHQFQGNTLFERALKEAFETFVNEKVEEKTTAEMISTFCDRVLKKNSSSDNEMESLLEKTVQLFSYLSEKDLFSEIYRNQLAKRLLNNKSSSDDAERSMITKLKARCGAQFTSKMEGMVKDLLTGETLAKDFSKHLKDREGSEEGSLTVNGVQFTVDVLTTGFWPTYNKMELNYPQVMTLCMDEYKKFYESKTAHRCLKWVHSLGSADVSAKFKKTYKIKLTTLQTVALMVFNDTDDWISFETVRTRLNVEKDIASKVLHSLSMNKYKVLLKDGERKLEPTDNFKVNKNFSAPKTQFAMAMPSLEKTHNPKRVEEDRSIAIEAKIVRIMKARKKLDHNTLMADVLAQLHFFRPEPRHVKSRIEHLIEREYLARDENESNKYIYLA